MEKIINLIEDKIREAENETSEDYSEDLLQGYKNGLEHAIIILKELNYLREINSIKDRAKIINTIAKDLKNIKSESLKEYARAEIEICSNGILRIIERDLEN